METKSFFKEKVQLIVGGFCLFLILGLSTSFYQSTVPKSTLSKRVTKKLTPQLKKEFKKKQFNWGSEIYIRVFKFEKELEVWIKKDKQFHLFKTYDICYYSGGLGSKTKQGDGKSPEGFYYLKASSMNPYSKYHLSFNIGYPNAYERNKNYTGSALMVHGKCVSIGCYAMGDKNIEEIYTLVENSFEHQQSVVRVHVFPFKFSQERMNLKKVRSSKWYPFWINLYEGYAFFEQTKVPPNVTVKNSKYAFN